jgi:hypothetical protein
VGGAGTDALAGEFAVALEEFEGVVVDMGVAAGSSRSNTVAEAAVSSAAKPTVAEIFGAWENPCFSGGVLSQ